MELSDSDTDSCRGRSLSGSDTDSDFDPREAVKLRSAWSELAGTSAPRVPVQPDMSGTSTVPAFRTPLRRLEPPEDGLEFGPASALSPRTLANPAPASTPASESHGRRCLPSIVLPEVAALPDMRVTRGGVEALSCDPRPGFEVVEDEECYEVIEDGDEALRPLHDSGAQQSQHWDVGRSHGLDRVFEEAPALSLEAAGNPLIPRSSGAKVLEEPLGQGPTSADTTAASDLEALSSLSDEQSTASSEDMPVSGADAVQCLEACDAAADHATAHLLTWQLLAGDMGAVRGLPENCSRALFLEVLDGEGFAGQYECVYMPVDTKRQRNFGYAFVTMSSAEAAERMAAAFNGKTRDLPSQQVCSLSWNCPDRGLKTRQRVMTSTTPRLAPQPSPRQRLEEKPTGEYRPLWFINGESTDEPPVGPRFDRTRIR